MTLRLPAATRRRLQLVAASALVLVSMPAAPSLVGGEATARTSSRTTLPRVVIRAPNGIVDEPKRRATMKVIDPARRGKRRTNYAGPIGIELRGVSSLSVPKKSYGVEIRTRSGEHRNFSLLGMSKDDDWVLVANYRDKSLLRNVVAYSAARWLGRYASRTRFVEVIVNSRYKGVYVLAERLKLHKQRIAVNESGISGGYFLELTGMERVGRDRFFETPVTKKPVVYSDPTGAELSNKRAEWIRDFVGRFERALYGSAFADPQLGYSRYLDLDAAVDYVLLNELFKNDDTFRLSTYMHKGVGRKLVLGPLWDFDHALGNNGLGNRVHSVDGWEFADRTWAKRLYADPAFRARLVTRWRSIRRRGLLRHIVRTIDRGARQLKAARARNFRRWRILGVDLEGNAIDPRTGRVPKTYAQELDYLKWWLKSRVRWIDSQIG